ncbi:hypothetical protein FACS1894201_09640 [Bacteroidia bacterium]|nr:hypothetical protein FACS1894201_09640 [Bacteroidia bacterium]
MILLMLCSVVLYGQYEQTSYFYDAAGNRVQRLLLLVSSEEDVEGDGEVQRVQYSDKVGNIDYVIYPNPTQGSVHIAATQADEGAIEVYDLQGRQVYHHKGAIGEHSIDLTRFSAGTYILRVVAGEQQVDWKIVKQ